MNAVQASETRSDTLSGRVVVVTGSTRGIGRAILLEAAVAGADVVVHGRDPHAAAEVAERVRTLGAGCRVVLANLTDAEAHERLIAQAWEWRGRVDAWVNNAGADVLTGPAAAASFDEKLERLWRVDVLATVRLSRSVGRRMRAFANQPACPVGWRGAILNMGWDQALTGMAGDSGELFAAAKGAVIAASRSLAKSLAPHVRVNCLAPGWIETAWGAAASPKWRRRGERESLSARWGTPIDVARAACFLLSPAADFINGQVIEVNGGFRGSQEETEGDDAAAP